MSRPSRIAAPLTALNGLTVCLILCSASLYASEAAGPVHVTILTAVALYQRWRWGGRGGAPEARRWWWEAAAFGTLVFFVADLFVISRSLIGAALRLLVFIVAYHADTPQSPRAAKQTLGLTFIQMIAASASTTEIGFSVYMVAYLLASLWTLAALGAAERENPEAPLAPRAPSQEIRVPLARLTAGLAPVVVGAGLLVFFCVPHYGTGYFRETGRSIRRSLSGFSDRIELGSIGSIKRSHATVMRVRRAESAVPPPLPLRMRGIALDSYDGRTWRVGDPHRRALRPDGRGAYLVAPDRLPEGADARSFPTGSPRERRQERLWLSLEILLEPLEAPVLFTPPEVVSVTITRFHVVSLDRNGSVFMSGAPMRRIPYRTASLLRRLRPAAVPGDSPPEGALQYLALPPLDPRIADLARVVTRGIGSVEEKARALEQHLLRDYTYSLDVNDAEVEAPLVHFLVERRPGHCEYFATALSVLLRVTGIPSRVVNGFYGGDHSALTDQTVLRQSDAHSWVEAWIPGQGWITLDPTPPDPTVWTSDRTLLARLRRLIEETEIAWDTYIIGLDIEDQRNMLEDARDRIDLALAGAVIRTRGLIVALERILGSPGRGVTAFVILAAGLGAAAAAFLGLRAGWSAWRSARSGAPPPHPATRLFLRLERAWARRGLRRDPSVSPAAFARGAGAPDVASAFEAARYGPTALQQAALEALGARIADHEARLRR